MPLGAIILVDSSFPDAVVEGWKRAARDFGDACLADVTLMRGDQAALAMLASQLSAQAAQWTRLALELNEPPPPPMTSAPFLFREDGRPDWAAMWTGFCELALYGGPPHRGPSESLTAIEAVPAQEGAFNAVAEIRRGIFETTGLFAEPADQGWLAVSCHSSRMAAWLCASIILENVDARCDGERLLVPASPAFALQDQVKSVVTVVAKTHHYWDAHVAAGGQ